MACPSSILSSFLFFGHVAKGAKVFVFFVVVHPQVRSPTNARCAAKLSARVPTSSLIVVNTPASSPLVVIYVGKVSRERWICGDIGRHSMVWNESHRESRNNKNTMWTGFPFFLMSCPGQFVVWLFSHFQPLPATKQEVKDSWPASCRTYPKDLERKMECQGWRKVGQGLSFSVSLLLQLNTGTDNFTLPPWTPRIPYMDKLHGAFLWTRKFSRFMNSLVSPTVVLS